MKTLLFQGDSITDCGRDRNNEQNLGDGYPNILGSKLAYEADGDIKIYNKGVGGNRIVDVYARIKSDIINLKPDYMSILIGVNDVWHEFGGHNGVDAEKFEKIYTMLIEEVKAALPDIKIMILAPYVLEGSATTATEEEPDRWNIFKTEVAKRAEAAKRVAEKFGLPLVTLQDKFDAAAKRSGNSTAWTAEGVHPTHAGHELIARAWLEGFEKLKNNN